MHHYRNGTLHGKGKRKRRGPSRDPGVWHNLTKRRLIPAPPTYFTNTIFLISCDEPARSEYRYVPDGSERASNVTR